MCRRSRGRRASRRGSSTNAACWRSKRIAPPRLRTAFAPCWRTSRASFRRASCSARRSSSQDRENEAVAAWREGYAETGSPIFLQRIEDHFIEQEEPLRGDRDPPRPDRRTRTTICCRASTSAVSTTGSRLLDEAAKQLDGDRGPDPLLADLPLPGRPDPPSARRDGARGRVVRRLPRGSSRSGRADYLCRVCHSPARRMERLLPALRILELDRARLRRGAALARSAGRARGAGLGRRGGLGRDLSRDDRERRRVAGIARGDDGDGGDASSDTGSSSQAQGAVSGERDPAAPRRHRRGPRRAALPGARRSRAGRTGGDGARRSALQGGGLRAGLGATAGGDRRGRRRPANVLAVFERQGDRRRRERRARRSHRGGRAVRRSARRAAVPRRRRRARGQVA